MIPLHNQRTLIIHGLMGELMAALRPIGIDYMHGLADWLRAQGALPTTLRLPTAAPVETNALALRQAILADPAPALLIAHSKGGLETLAALLDPATAARTTAFIALQCPFFGSPIADLVTREKTLDAAARALARLLRTGSGDGIRDLTTTRRTAWMATHAEAIAALKTPIICLATALPLSGTRGRDRLYGPAIRWMAKRGDGPSDGLVPVASALIPGTTHLIREGSHVATVTPGGNRNPTVLLAEALAALA